MERNAIMNLNNIIYRIYETEELPVLKEQILYDIRMLIPCSFASILMAGSGQPGDLLKDPLCMPREFREAEERYICMEDQDYLLWTIRATQPVVIRESQVLSEEKRLQSPIYQVCYRDYDIYDTLQLSLVYDKVFLGVLTLFRTVAEGEFSEEDSFMLELLGPHLSRRFFLNESRTGDGREPSAGAEALREQYGLTRRETEILSLIFDNLSDEEILSRIHISPNTLKKHLQNIYHKLDISARWELMKYKG